MKTIFLLGLLAQAPAAATPPQLPRADAHVAAGWQNLRQAQPPGADNDWLNGIFYAGGGAGWFWNDHLKTQVDVGAGTRAGQYRFFDRVVDGNQTFQSSRLQVRETNVSIGQQYQFFRNQYFHPHVGAGLELARQTRTETFQPLTVYDTTTRVSRVLEPARTDGPEHRFIARAFAETGFKAYMTRTAFFTGDMRIMVRGSIDEVLFRAGFGIDF